MMTEPQGRRKSGYLTCRVDPRLLDRIDQEVKTRMVSRSYLLEKALEGWLAENEGAADG